MLYFPHNSLFIPFFPHNYFSFHYLFSIPSFLSCSRFHILDFFFPADFVLLFLILLIANYSIWLFYESLLHLLIIQSLICFLSKYFFNLIFLDLLLLLMLLLLQFLVWILLLLLLVLLALSPPLSSRLPPPVLLLPSLLSLPPFPNVHWPPSLPPALPHSIPPSLTQSHSLTPSFINTRSLQKNHMSHP